MEELEFPDSDVTSFVLERAGELGDKPALIDGPTGRKITFAELDGATRALAAGLAGTRLRPRRRARHLHAQPARVRGRVPRSGASGRAGDDREPALHGT